MGLDAAGGTALALNTVPQEATGGCSQSGVVVEVVVVTVVGWAPGGRLHGGSVVR